MSRTVKGAKSPGWEIWSKRGFTGWNNGRRVKFFTHKVERQKAKSAARAEVQAMRVVE